MANKQPKSAAADACCECGRALGVEPQVQPTLDDGQAWCPPCFIGVRAAREPDRWGPFFAAVRCQFCHWESLATAQQQAMTTGFSCSHCGKPGALRVREI